MTSLKYLIAIISLPACAVAQAQESAKQDFFRYLTEIPAGSALTANSACCFDPVTTPAGHLVTAFAPEDHRHHRGIFLAWVQMHGSVDADFWGWGAHAPVENRRMLNRSITRLPDKDDRITFTAVNDWMAGETVMLQETLTAIGQQRDSANVLELTYALRPSADVTLARWAFGGFCVRYPKLGEAVLHNPQGIVTLPDPSHKDPDSNWPDAAWYAATWKTDMGAAVGVAVVPRGTHPAQTWHCPRTIRMLNPAITAPAPVTLKGGVETTLRYAVVAFDGEVPAALLNSLSAEPLPKEAKP